jgi:hypothetical protein
MTTFVDVAVITFYCAFEITAVIMGHHENFKRSKSLDEREKLLKEREFKVKHLGV